MLNVGQEVRAHQLQTTLRVRKKLGEGGQGAVFLVEGQPGQFALKWYNHNQATDEQRAAIWDLVTEHRLPPGKAGERFVWPLDLVTCEESPLFGYLMHLIDMTRFAELGQVMARLKPSPGLDVLCEISYQLANSYRALHLAGYCYRDISRNNVLFDPITGDVLICDNDNIGINKQSTCQVWGTLEFMAPELIRGDEQHPSTDTDLHSLAVLLFYLWIWHHPLHGEQEYRIRSWDLQAKKLIYGLSPIFIWDPQDNRNRLPQDPGYQGAAIRWEMCPSALRELFTKAFTEGLKNPSKRVTEGEWQRLFLQLKDVSLPCSKCQAVNLWDQSSLTKNCWNCRTKLPTPLRLQFNLLGQSLTVVLTSKTKIYQRHIDLSAQQAEKAYEPIGEVVAHPKNPKQWGLKNLSCTTWTARAAGNPPIEVIPGNSVGLVAGMKLQIGNVTAELLT